VVSYAAVQRLPYGVDELAVAGGLAGEPIRVVKCKTVDLEVPAEAELVIEGLVSTEWVEPEGPFGESHGYVHLRGLNPFMEITAITHRRDMVYVSFISQVTPSESSVIKKVGYDTLFLRFLQEEKKVRSIRRVVMHEPLTNLRKLIILQMEKPSVDETWHALEAALTFHKDVGKLLIAVDADIDPENLDAVMWALSYRMNPQHDVKIVTGRGRGHAPRKSEEESAEDSALLINAILKESYPPVSLPARRYMDRARELWEELKLPPLSPEAPWHGYSLGDWDEEFEEEARLAVLGECYQIGEKLARRRVKVEGTKIPDLPKRSDASS
jgi:4-hydroxy-3-polyprenylbenzoate decarboxylase